MILSPSQIRYTLFEIDCGFGDNPKYFTDYHKNIYLDTNEYLSQNIQISKYQIQVYTQEILLKGFFNADGIQDKSMLGFLKIDLSACAVGCAAFTALSRHKRGALGLGAYGYRDPFCLSGVRA